MIGKAIYDRLNSDTDVNALVDGRIVPGLGDEQEDFPVIVYSTQNAEDDASYSGLVNPIKKTLTIVAVATSYDGCDLLADKVKAALDNQSGVWGGITVQGAFFESETDDVFTIGDDGGTRYYQKEQEYTIWFNQS